MRIAICTSQSTDIDEKYIESSKKIIKYLAEKNFDLNWGGVGYSIMGVCYDEFTKNNKKAYAYKTPKYLDDLKDLPKAKHQVFDTTFDLKKNLFNDSKIIVMLPGGIGSISELFSYLEEIRSNGKNQLLIIYNESHHFDKTIELINDLVERKFADKSIYNFFKIANNFEEFKEIIENIKK